MRLARTLLTLPAGLMCCAVLAVPGPPQARGLPSSGPPATPRTDRYGDPLPKGAVARLGTVRYRHDGSTFGQFSADGRSLLLLGPRGCQWVDLATGKVTGSLPIQVYRYPGSQRFNAVAAAQAPVLAVDDEQDDFVVYDTATGKQLALFQRGGSFALSPDGQRLVLWDVPGQPDRILVRDTLAKKRLYRFSGKAVSSFTVATVSPDGNRLAAVGRDKKDWSRQRLFTWDLGTGKLLREVVLSTETVERLELLPNGKELLATAPYDGSVRLLDAATGKVIRTFPMVIRTFPARFDFVYTFAVSPDGKRLYTAEPGKVQEWDLATGKPERVLHSHLLPADDLVVPLAAPDGKQLVGLGYHTWTTWDLDSGKETAATTGHLGPVGGLAFAPDGRTLLTAGSDKTARVWDVAAGKQTMRLEIQNDEAAPGTATRELWFRQCAFSADGKVLAANGRDEALHLWDAATGKLLYRIDKEENWSPFAFGPHGQVLALLQVNRRLSLWHAGSGKQLRSWDPAEPTQKPGPGAPWLFALAWSPDGRLLAVPRQPAELPDVHIDLWEIATLTKRKTVVFQPGARTAWQVEPVRTMVQRRFGGVPYNLAGYVPSLQVAGSCVVLLFTPDGKHLAVATADAVYLFDVGNGKQVRSFGGPHVWGRSIAFSPDGKLLAAGRMDGSLRLWDVATGTICRDVPGHQSAVSAVAFSPDGRCLASASLDSTVMVWQVKELLP
jgi:WD40 repeat protein